MHVAPAVRHVGTGTGVTHVRLWFGRDAAGQRGQAQALALINESGQLTASGFDWQVAFPSPVRSRVSLPEDLKDPGDFSAPAATVSAGAAADLKNGSNR